MFDGYGLGGFTKDIKLSPEEVEKIKSNLIEWDGEFYPKSVFEWKNPEDLYKLAINQQIEINRLNNIINEFENILKRDIRACNNKFENMIDRNYRRLILEEKLEQLQELKGDDNNGIKK